MFEATHARARERKKSRSRMVMIMMIWCNEDYPTNPHERVKRKPNEIIRCPKVKQDHACVKKVPTSTAEWNSVENNDKAMIDDDDGGNERRWRWSDKKRWEKWVGERREIQVHNVTFLDTPHRCAARRIEWVGYIQDRVWYGLFGGQEEVEVPRWAW